MYLQFFGFEQSPFDITPDPQFLFQSTQHNAALASLCYGVQNKKGFAVLCGEIGTGKTLITRTFLTQIEDSADTAYILNPFLNPTELLMAINKEFGNDIGSVQRWDVLCATEKFLLDHLKTGRSAVVAIDEAQHIAFESLEMLRILSNLETDKEKLLQIILVGQPELERKLKNHVLRQLFQRIQVWVRLGPLDFNETCAYVLNRLEIAGAKLDFYFTKTALKQLYKHTKGFPRLINVACDRMLLEAYASNKVGVDRRVAKIAMQDLRG